jgi:protein disulfide-isomerase A6
MPSSRSSISSSKSSRTARSSSSSSRGMSKDNYSILMLLVIIAILFAVYYYSYKSNSEPFSNASLNLKPEQGETVVALFYADWCPHCVAFKPDYEKAMSSLSGNEYKGKTLRLELVDCVENKTIASENNVNGFPTVKIFTDDNKSSEYSGERTYEGLTSYFS